MKIVKLFVAVILVSLGGQVHAADYPSPRLKGLRVDDAPVFAACTGLMIGAGSSPSSCSAPSYFATGTNAANLTGTLNAAQMPALTGDVTTTVGTVATTVGSIGGKTVSLGGNLSTTGAGSIILGFPATAATFTFPAATATIASLAAQTFTGAQTFPASGIILKGSSTGVTTFTSANSSASSYTLTFPAATDAVAAIAATQTLTNKTISGAANTLSNIGNSSLTNSSMTIAGHTVSLGGTQAIDVADLTTTSLPTTLPASAGVTWSNGGMICVSQ